MFKNKKILAALLCTPLFGACVVNGDDEAGDSGSGETTNTTTATTATTEMTAGSSGETSSASTVSATTSADSGSSGSVSADSGGSTTDTGGGGMACFLSCTEAADCCDPADPMCADGLGTYPYDYTCEADGTCSAGPCTADEQCQFGGALPGYVCGDVDGTPACVPGCTMDSDCEDQFLMGYTCTGDGGAAGMYCVAPPCMADEDCDPGMTGVLHCNAGACEFACATDDDCTMFGGGGTCNTDDGTCGCATTDDCPEGYTCAGT
jgi:hypothetical protein